MLKPRVIKKYFRVPEMTDITPEMAAYHFAEIGPGGVILVEVDGNISEGEYEVGERFEQSRGT